MDFVAGRPKLFGLKQHTFLIVQVCNSEIPKWVSLSENHHVGLPMFPSGESGSESLLMAPTFVGFWLSSSIFEATDARPSLTLCHSDLLCLSFPLLRGPCDCTGLIWITCSLSPMGQVTCIGTGPGNLGDGHLGAAVILCISPWPLTLLYWSWRLQYICWGANEIAGTQRLAVSNFGFPSTALFRLGTAYKGQKLRKSVDCWFLISLFYSSWTRSFCSCNPEGK